jgi:hypothetical protein
VQLVFVFLVDTADCTLIFAPHGERIFISSSETSILSVLEYHKNTSCPLTMENICNWTLDTEESRLPAAIQSHSYHLTCKYRTCLSHQRGYGDNYWTFQTRAALACQLYRHLGALQLLALNDHIECCILSQSPSWKQT